MSPRKFKPGDWVVMGPRASEYVLTKPGSFGVIGNRPSSADRISVYWYKLTGALTDYEERPEHFYVYEDELMTVGEYDSIVPEHSKVTLEVVRTKLRIALNQKEKTNG